MIDYIKILLSNIDVTKLLKSPFLEFRTEVSTKTGLLSPKRVAEYHYCKIIVYDTGVVLFTGSIHKLWNSLNGIKAPNYKMVKIYKGFNGNQFAYEDIIAMRNHLENLFDCEPHQMVFQNIELGVNTTPEFNPKLYIKGLLYHKNKLFEYRYNGNLAQAEHQRLIFKIYNKSNQYGMSEFTLRIELKITKIEELKTIDLRTFADINETTLVKVKQMLLDRFNEVMHYDYTINKKVLTKKQNQLLKSYSNPRYWIVDLKPQHRHRHKIRLKEITIKYSENLHQQLRENIIQKCVIINRLSESSMCVIINSSSIGLSLTQNTLSKPPKKCIVTGLDISMQKEESFLLSHSGLKHYLKKDYQLFEELKLKYLTNKWNHSNLDIQIKEIAHNIRTNKYNKTNKQRRLYQPQQTNFLSQLGM
ncbi:MAG: hypothetical protein Q7U08_02715 [Flavobacteriaceae bacterium]|nr:hypothetical protein [Flavobacteriaceae bacterium]